MEQGGATGKRESYGVQSHRSRRGGYTRVVLQLSLFAALVASLAVLPRPAQAGLQQNFYRFSCPNAEKIIKRLVLQAVRQDVRNAARLLRLHFHDCFVRGCDASVLLDNTDGVQSEKEASINFSLDAFDVVDNIKSQLENACPGTVSCADILAIAARDSVRAVGGPYIPMRTGRRDGFLSLGSETTSLPTFTDVTGLIRTFNNVGLNTVDLVALSGAHTIGQGHCTSVSNRITGNIDSLMDPTYRNALRRVCINFGQIQNLVPIVNDIITPNLFDNQYYINLRFGRGTFISDQLLNQDRRTRFHVAKYAQDQLSFFRQFNKSMLKMSEIQPLTGGRGEIRFQCSSTNEY